MPEEASRKAEKAASQRLLLEFALGSMKIVSERLTRLLLPLVSLAGAIGIWLRVERSPSREQLVLLALYGLLVVLPTLFASPTSK